MATPPESVVQAIHELYAAFQKAVITRGPSLPPPSHRTVTATAEN